MEADLHGASSQAYRVTRPMTAPDPTPAALSLKPTELQPHALDSNFRAAHPGPCAEMPRSADPPVSRAGAQSVTKHPRQPNRHPRNDRSPAADRIQPAAGDAPCEWCHDSGYVTQWYRIRGQWLELEEPCDCPAGTWQP